MTEVYPLRAPNNLVGGFCDGKSCDKYARFAVRSFGTNGKFIKACSMHLSNAVKGIFILEGRAAVVQEIAGNWRNDVIMIEGTVVRVDSGDRKQIGATE